MSGRREQVLRAAVEVLGGEGSRRLTYQAVDAAAGAPAGTTSNHFRNRAALIDGILDHLQAVELRDWETFASHACPASPGELAAAMGRFVQLATGPERARTAARHALMLEAAARPELRTPFTRAHARIASWAAERLQDLGSPFPERHGRLLLNCLEGMMFHQISFPAEDFDPVPELRALLEGLLGRKVSFGSSAGQAEGARDVT